MNPLHPPRDARSVLRTQSDERLTELARHGSDAAFETLVTRYRRSLVGHCGRVLGHADAEEAVQNALVNAHHALRRGDSVRSIGPWLHAIAHNAALNILRSRASRRECAYTDPHQLHQRHDPAVEHREELRELVEVMQALPLRQRDAIVMRELEGLSYDEIAARLGSSSGAVRQLLNRARHSIRERLGALTGLEPLIRWFADGGSAPSVARLGALAGGCAVTAKLCTVALIPGVWLTPHSTRPNPAPNPARAGRPAATSTAARLSQRARPDTSSARLVSTNTGRVAAYQPKPRLTRRLTVKTLHRPASEAPSRWSPVPARASALSQPQAPSQPPSPQARSIQFAPRAASAHAAYPAPSPTSTPTTSAPGGRPAQPAQSQALPPHLDG